MDIYTKCNKDTESESFENDGDGYEEYDHFGDFIEFKKELKTNVSFLQEVSITYFVTSGALFLKY